MCIANLAFNFTPSFSLVTSTTLFLFVIACTKLFFVPLTFFSHCMRCQIDTSAPPRKMTKRDNREKKERERKRDIKQVQSLGSFVFFSGLKFLFQLALLFPFFITSCCPCSLDIFILSFFLSPFGSHLLRSSQSWVENPFVLSLHYFIYWERSCYYSEQIFKDCCFFFLTIEMLVYSCTSVLILIRKKGIPLSV